MSKYPAEITPENQAGIELARRIHEKRSSLEEYLFDLLFPPEETIRDKAKKVLSFPNSSQE